MPKWSDINALTAIPVNRGGEREGSRTPLFTLRRNIPEQIGHSIFFAFFRSNFLLPHYDQARYDAEGANPPERCGRAG